MSFRVAFDLDGTVADLQAALRREAELLFGPEMSVVPGQLPSNDGNGEPPDIAARPLTALHLTPKQQAQLWTKVRQIPNFWVTLPEMETGIIERIARLASGRRWEVLFITTRPETAGEPTQLQSQRWLDAKGFPFPAVAIVPRSRGKLADSLQLDAVVDDRPEHAVDVAVESHAKSMLIWTDPVKDLPAGTRRLGVQIMPSIGDAVTALERLDDTRKQSVVVRSIRRMLGRDPATR